jgi:hypothetical protein
MGDALGEFAFATFHSTHMVLKGEKVLHEADIPGVRLVPVPSQLSSDCGVSVRFPAAAVEQAAPLLEALGEDLEGVFVERGGRWEPYRSS